MRRRQFLNHRKKEITEKEIAEKEITEKEITEKEITEKEITEKDGNPRDEVLNRRKRQLRRQDQEEAGQEKG